MKNTKESRQSYHFAILKSALLCLGGSRTVNNVNHLTMLLRTLGLGMGMLVSYGMREIGCFREEKWVKVL